MKGLMKLHYVLVVGGLIGGLVVGAFLIDVRPAFFGWLLGAGAGLTGGAFLAALVSGQSLVSGPAPSSFQLDYEFDEEQFEDEIPRLLRDLPPREDRGRNGGRPGQE